MSRTVTIQARALLFDMDGTLVDSLAAVEQIWTRLATRFGHDVDDVLSGIHGVRAEDSIRRYAPLGSDLDALNAELDAFELDNSHSTIEIPGARDLLASLPDESVAIVTSSGPKLAAGRLRGAGLAVPTTLITAADVQVGKPDPEGYLLAADRLGVTPADAIVFEDAEAGISAGLAAGMRVVVVGRHDSDLTEGFLRVRDHRQVGVARLADGALAVRFTQDI